MKPLLDSMLDEAIEIDRREHPERWEYHMKAPDPIKYAIGYTIGRYGCMGLFAVFLVACAVFYPLSDPSLLASLYQQGVLSASVVRAANWLVFTLIGCLSGIVIVLSILVIITLVSQRSRIRAEGEGMNLFQKLELAVFILIWAAVEALQPTKGDKNA